MDYNLLTQLIEADLFRSPSEEELKDRDKICPPEVKADIEAKQRFERLVDAHLTQVQSKFGAVNANFGWHTDNNSISTKIFSDPIIIVTSFYAPDGTIKHEQKLAESKLQENDLFKGPSKEDVKDRDKELSAKLKAEGCPFVIGDKVKVINSWFGVVCGADKIDIHSSNYPDVKHIWQIKVAFSEDINDYYWFSPKALEKVK